MVTFLSTFYHDHTSTLWLLLPRNTCCFYATQCVMHTSCQRMTAWWLHQVVASTQHLWFTRNTLCCDVRCCFDATGRGGVGYRARRPPPCTVTLDPRTIFFSYEDLTLFPLGFFGIFGIFDKQFLFFFKYANIRVASDVMRT